MLPSPHRAARHRCPGHLAHRVRLHGFAAAASRAAEAIALLERAAEIDGVLAAPVLVFPGRAHLAGDRVADAQVAAQRAIAATLYRQLEMAAPPDAAP